MIKGQQAHRLVELYQKQLPFDAEGNKLQGMERVERDVFKIIKPGTFEARIGVVTWKPIYGKVEAEGDARVSDYSWKDFREGLALATSSNHR